jgi:hypothetical protein
METSQFRMKEFTLRRLEITCLPLDAAERSQFIETANTVFEEVLQRLDLGDPDAIRALWDAGEYVDNVLLHETMLPISVDYARSLVDAFLVHHVIGLVGKAKTRVQ